MHARWRLIRARVLRRERVQPTCKKAHERALLLFRSFSNVSVAACEAWSKIAKAARSRSFQERLRENGSNFNFVLFKPV